MRILLIFIVSGGLVLPSTLFSATTIQPANTTIHPPELSKKLASLKIRDVQKLIGRKLTFKEKLSFLILKHSSKKETQSNKGSTALGFGIAALGCLLVGLFVPFVIWLALIGGILAIVLGSKAKKLDPNDKNAHTAVTLGWVAVGIFTLIVIAAIIVVASGAWWWY